LSRDEDYELWLAMNEDFEQAQVTEVAPVEAVVPAEFAPIFEQSVDQEEIEAEEPVAPTLEFELSPSLIREPQTNTIVIQPVDPLATGSISTDAGEIVLTGSIELPPITGGIEIVSMPDENKADANLADDFADNYVSSIAPVRASGVMNSRARESVLPIKNRRGESQAVLLGVTSILMVTVGALLIAAFWLGVLKF
jgi:hypothetical protein